MPQSPSSSSSSEANLFRKKPVVISAVQYTEAIRDAHLFDGADLPAGVFIPRRTINPADRKVWSADAYINTLEGQQMSVSLGDWVITGVQGEHYPCKPEIFAATYESASTAATPPSLPIDFKQASEQRGWQLVPKEPTPEMIEAAMQVKRERLKEALMQIRAGMDETEARAPVVMGEWDAMLAASPSPHPEEGALLLGGDEGGKKGGA